MALKYGQGEAIITVRSGKGKKKTEFTTYRDDIVEELIKASSLAHGMVPGDSMIIQIRTKKKGDPLFTETKKKARGFAIHKEK